MPLQLDYPQPYYPFKTGYADITSVQANVITWDPNKPGTLPTLASVNDWLRKGTAAMDAAMMSRGYSVPLTASSGYAVPTGFAAINGLHPALYQTLEMICAAYATHFVEAARHGSRSLNADDNAAHWMHMFDDFITRVETGADNLTAWGAQGPFPPEIDPAKAMQTGNLGAFVATDNQPSLDTESPLFSRRTMNWS